MPDAAIRRSFSRTVCGQARGEESTSESDLPKVTREHVSNMGILLWENSASFARVRIWTPYVTFGPRTSI
jgi:hypothetical protein